MSKSPHTPAHVIGLPCMTAAALLAGLILALLGGPAWRWLAWTLLALPALLLTWLIWRSWARALSTSE